MLVVHLLAKELLDGVNVAALGAEHGPFQRAFLPWLAFAALALEQVLLGRVELLEHARSAAAEQVILTAAQRQRSAAFEPAAAPGRPVAVKFLARRRKTVLTP